MTKGSQQSGKQIISIAAKKIHPPVDNLFLTRKGIPSWPQNGHFDVTGILISPFTYMLCVKFKLKAHYQSEAFSVNAQIKGGAQAS
ncbi:MAG: hypothetical protein ABSC77_03465 [Terracidiphilus sp.]|jgi:hypothetical protein